jgi:hypothetical protein
MEEIYRAFAAGRAPSSVDAGGGAPPLPGPASGGGGGAG